MADSKNCDMEPSERTRMDKETVENVMIAHGDKLVNANLQEANERTKTIPSNEELMCDENNLHFGNCSKSIGGGRSREGLGHQFLSP